jgi:hypothetical protein
MNIRRGLAAPLGTADISYDIGSWWSDNLLDYHQCILATPDMRVCGLWSVFHQAGTALQSGASTETIRVGTI